MDELQNNNLTSKEIYDLKKKEKEQMKKKDQLKKKVGVASKKIRNYTIYTLITIAVIGGIVWFASLVPSLPPTSAENHSEDSPATHILTTRIPDAVQRHMLEHSDGNGPSGIIIQYNCDKYDCEDGMIEQLTNLASEYPRNVYLAPNNYDGKIILTRVGKKEILDQFDEQKIRDFIQ